MALVQSREMGCYESSWFYKKAGKDHTIQFIMTLVTKLVCSKCNMKRDSYDQKNIYFQRNDSFFGSPWSYSLWLASL